MQLSGILGRLMLASGAAGRPVGGGVELARGREVGDELMGGGAL